MDLGKRRKVKMVGERRVFSLNEMEVGQVYRHLENNHNYRLHEGELQKFGCGCWNNSVDPICTTKSFVHSENWDDLEVFYTENPVKEVEPEKPNLHILDFSKKEAEAEAKELKNGELPPLGKYDFIFQDNNIYLEAIYCQEGGIHLSYYRFATIEDMKRFMPDHAMKAFELMKDSMPNIAKFMIKQQLEETEIHLTKWDRFKNFFPYINITVESKVKKQLPRFKKFQEKEIIKFHENVDNADKLNDLIKGKES